MGSNVYDIDYNKLVQWLLPVKRKAITVSWLITLIAPVKTAYLNFLRYRTAKLYDLLITPQVCYLERLLNDKYDFSQRRIRIVDTIDHSPLWIFQSTELKPVYISLTSENAPNYLFTDSEAGSIQDDFVIKVPASITFSDNEMLQLVKGYRLAAMKPKIQRT